MLSTFLYNNISVYYFILTNRCGIYLVMFFLSERIDVLKKVKNKHKNDGDYLRNISYVNTKNGENMGFISLLRTV